jgi:hypothetical protein
MTGGTATQSAGEPAVRWGEDVELLDSTIPPRSLLAEADGNRTRLGALAPTPVLKTGGPTRRPDASKARGYDRRQSGGLEVAFVS